MNEEEKQAVEILNTFEFRSKTKNYKGISLEDSKSVKIVLNLIDKLQKENEELKKSKITYEKVRDIQEKNRNIVDNKYISKQKVKDKIEELDEELEIMKVDNMYSRYKEYGGKSKWERLFATKYGMHDALQELLEGRK